MSTAALLAMALIVVRPASGQEAAVAEKPALPALAGNIHLDGAFIQFDAANRQWTPAEWQAMLGRMRQVKCHLILLQYLQTRERGGSVTAENYLPAKVGDPDPLRTILDDADAHGMKVFIGLRFDKSLMDSEFLSQPDELRARLKGELSRNVDLARSITAAYGLKDRASFAGWYLPVEIANFKDDASRPEDGWVRQLNGFTTSLVAACKREVSKPVAVSPYFHGRFDDPHGRPDLVPPDVMGRNYARYLQGTGIDIVMLQDSVGVDRIPAADVERYVRPHLLAIAEACRQASPPGAQIELWLNVESIGADIGRLRRQLEVGRGHVRRRITFDFPHHLNRSPLYDEYLKFITSDE